MKNKYEEYWQEKFSNDKSIKIFSGWLNQNPSRKHTCEIVKNLVEEGAKNILDVGCGTGLDYAEYKENGINIEYSGVDVTPYFIGKLKEKYENATFKVGRAQEIPWEDNSFDIVSSRHVLEHLNDPNNVLKEMTRVSKRWVMNTFFRLGGKTKYQKSKRGNLEVVVNDYSADEMRKMFENNGLKIIIEKRVDDKRKNGTNHIWLAEKQNV